MFKHRKRIDRTTRSRRRNSSRGLRFEELESRRVLATLTVGAAGATSENPTSSPVNNGVLTLREAIAYVNGTIPGAQDALRINTFGGTQPLGINDTIVFDSNIYGQTITITGGNLIVSRRVTITGPTGANQITIQKGASSTATVGLRFSGFNLSPVGSLVTELTGVSNLRITGFGTGIEVASLSSTNYDIERPLHIVGNEITNNATGISINGSNIPFKIEGNRIVGTSPTAGLGISLTNSNQTVVNLPAEHKPTIGNHNVTNGGNLFGTSRRIRGVSSAMWLAA